LGARSLWGGKPRERHETDPRQHLDPPWRAGPYSGGMSRVILHADMDAFYASVEQRDRPELKGLPVIIGGLGKRGVVSTASYEARRFGVHSAMPGAQARRLCPDGIFLAGRMEAYSEASALIREAFLEFTDLVEPLSLDEAFLDVTGSVRLFGDGRQIAQALREQILSTTRLTVSVGVAASKFVAKVASDHEKPDGLTVVPPGTEAEFLGALPVGRLWGAGKVTRDRMERLGLRTIADIQALSIESLVAHFGASAGRHYHALCRGHDERPVVVSGGPLSVSRETTFEEDVSSGERLRTVLLALSEDVGSRLRRKGLVGETVRLKLRYPPFETLTRQQHMARPTHDDMEIHAAAVALLEKTRPSDRPVRLIGVGVTDLGSAARPVQAELFAAAQPDGRVDRTLDEIRERFGKGAAHRGR
jgi:DNA polymerase-4